MRGSSFSLPCHHLQQPLLWHCLCRTRMDWFSYVDCLTAPSEAHNRQEAGLSGWLADGGKGGWQMVEDYPAAKRNSKPQFQQNISPLSHWYTWQTHFQSSAQFLLLPEVFLVYVLTGRWHPRIGQHSWPSRILQLGQREGVQVNLRPSLHSH